jgi:hypothetical protein
MIVLWLTLLSGCYLAIENHVDVKGPLQKIGLLSSKPMLHRGRLPSNPSMQPILKTACWFAVCKAYPASRHAPHVLLHGTAGTAGKEYDDTAEQAAEAGAAQAEQGWWDRVLTGSSSSLALAFLCNKALFPVRTPITLALTPAVAR